MLSTKIYLVIILLLSFFMTELSCQIEFLDVSFGQNGTAEILLGDSLAATTFGLAVEKNGRIYFSYDSPLSNGLKEAGIRRLSSKGELLDWKITNDFDFDNYSWEQYLFDDGKIIASFQALDSLYVGTVNDFEVYDLEGNLLNDFHHIDPGGNYFFYYNLDRSYLMDHSDRLVYSSYDGLSRYLKSETIDVGFGENGFASIRDLIPIQDSIIFWTIWNTIYESHDHSLVASYYNIEEIDSTVLSFEYLVKFDENGQVDKSFGDNGKVKFDDSPNGIVWEVEDYKDGYLMHDYSFIDQDSCWYYSRATVLDKNGQIDRSYGNNGRLIPDEEDCYNSYWWFQVGPEDEVIALETDFEVDEITQAAVSWNYQFIKFDSSGKLDSSFADRGKLQLDFLQNHNIKEVVQDVDHNIYIMHDDSLVPKPFFITKFDGDQIWNRSVDVYAKGDFALTPNPTSGEIGLLYEGDRQERITVLLFDMQGRLVATKEILELSGQDRIKLGDRDLSAGAYFVKIRNVNGASIFSDKVIVIR